MTIPLVNLQRQHESLREEIRSAIDRVLSRGDFILGNDVEAFEQEFAEFLGVRHCIGVANGLDALSLALRGLGISHGDEVITQANTFIATALAIHQAGAIPVLVDHDPNTYNLDPRRLSAAITSRTKAIMPVHLYGQPADMEAIQTIADEHGIPIIEDACQAHGAKYRGQRCGSFGRAAAFSFYPGKNLGALGDGGALVTNDDDLADWARTARNYGSKVKYKHTVRGFNSRLDTIHAAVLRAKMHHLDSWNETRRKLAKAYRRLLSNCPIVLPQESIDVEHVYHLFVIRSPRRDELLEAFKRSGVQAGIHYPIPIHQQVAFGRGIMVSGSLANTESFAEELISLPMCPFTTESEVEQVTEVIRKFHQNTLESPKSQSVATVRR